MADPELKAMLAKQAEAFEAFKAANDARLAQVEKKGNADPLIVDQVEKLNAKVGEQQKTIDALNAKAGRKPTSETDGEDEQKKLGKAFDGFLRKGRTEGLDELRQKAVSIGSNADGGYAVPQELERTVVQIEHKHSPLRDLCRVITVGNETHELLVGIGNAASGWVGETDARTETNTPQLATVIPSFGEIYSMPGATQRSLDDVFFDVSAWLAENVGREFGEQENLAFLSGNGTNKPKGMLNYTLSANPDTTRTWGQVQKIISATDGSLGADAGVQCDKLIDLVHALRPGYRLNAQFMMSNLTIAAVRKIKDDIGEYIWKPGLLAGQQSTLLGYPVNQNDDMADVGTTGANAIVFADFKRAYVIADRTGMVTLRDPYTAKPKVMFYTTKRVGGAVMDFQALKVFVLSAT